MMKRAGGMPCKTRIQIFYNSVLAFLTVLFINNAKIFLGTQGLFSHLYNYITQTEV